MWDSLGARVKTVRDTNRLSYDKMIEQVKPTYTEHGKRTILNTDRTLMLYPNLKQRNTKFTIYYIYTY